MSVVKSYNFYLNSLKAKSRSGSDVDFALPSNVCVSNSANNFTAYVNEASIPSYPLIISSANNNNTITMKLKVRVKLAWVYGLGNQVIFPIDETLDATQVQLDYIQGPKIYSYNTTTGILPIYSLTTPWGTVFTANTNPDPAIQKYYEYGPPNVNFVGPTLFCDNLVATVPDGIYLNKTDLLNAVQTAINSALAILSSNMNYFYINPPIPYNENNVRACYYNSPMACSPSSNFQVPTGAFNLTCTLAATSSNRTTITLNTNNNWGVQQSLGSTAQGPGFTSSTASGMVFEKYLLYFQASELMTMLGWPDEDFELPTTAFFPEYGTDPNRPQFILPNYYSARPPITYTSPAEVNIFPNTCTYITIPSLVQLNSYVAQEDTDTVVPSNILAVVYNSPTDRTNVYVSYPVKIQLTEKVLNSLTIVLQDYKNRPIPYQILNGSFFITLVLEETQASANQPQSLTLQQFYSQEEQFFKNKELELALQLESFIRTDR